MMTASNANWYRIACTHSSHMWAMLTVDAKWYRIACTHSSHKRVRLTVDAKWYHIACTHSSHKRAMLTVDAKWYRIAHTHSSHKWVRLTVDASWYRIACIHSFHNRVQRGLLITCERTVRPMEMDLISYMGQPKLNMLRIYYYMCQRFNSCVVVVNIALARFVEQHNRTFVP